eukprot:11637909-Alexandrium_andersonii.AAC.1
MQYRSRLEHASQDVAISPPLLTSLPNGWPSIEMHCVAVLPRVALRCVALLPAACLLAGCAVLADSKCLTQTDQHG